MVSGFLQAGMIPELFEQDRGDRKEDHAGYADRLVTSVEGKKRDDRRQTDLLADKSRLKRLPREGRNGVEDQKADAAGRVAMQKFEQRPWDQNSAGAEDRQRVDQRGQERKEQRIVRAEQEKAGRQEGDIVILFD